MLKDDSPPRSPRAPKTSLSPGRRHHHAMDEAQKAAIEQEKIAQRKRAHLVGNDYFVVQSVFLVFFYTMVLVL
jgi:hypothetical protein